MKKTLLVIFFISFCSVFTIAQPDLSPSVSELYQLGTDAMEAKEYNEAINYFDEAIQKNPSNAYLFESRGQCKQALGDERGAKRDLKKSEKLKSEKSTVGQYIVSIFASISGAITGIYGLR